MIFLVIEFAGRIIVIALQILFPETLLDMTYCLEVEIYSTFLGLPHTCWWSRGWTCKRSTYSLHSGALAWGPRAGGNRALWVHLLFAKCGHSCVAQQCDSPWPGGAPEGPTGAWVGWVEGGGCNTPTPVTSTRDWNDVALGWWMEMIPFRYRSSVIL